MKGRVFIQFQGIRIKTLCSDTIFGEMALIDNKPRSASVLADGDIVCYQLSLSALSEIKEKQPDIIFNILTDPGQELSNRLRLANLTNIS